ncbi:nucleoside-diphosphate-sugar epimerase [Gracilibacillus halophilus YIM-C55.5]|uniref:Nucleoside-diphosphate-sugar epimerase n=1 Tax=Gracilibacillus halophilus YIM-C55.5 TaxID=1308866 RepID=N4WHA3_9BACI|nr:NAD(P)-dependent oxidoreductase [Gracilibacillus halophilus]ENH95557.1 nucleoside-diphosphate-sugar epimerase [Gracilibacillus halophilus YIM-C55.5]
MKKIVIVGGAGTVGKILMNGLQQRYEVLVLDQSITSPSSTEQYVDATSYQQLLQTIPPDTDVLINLLRMETDQAVEPVETFEKMTAVFFKATYYLLSVAEHYQIPKVIFASSNHVTDYYEEDGYSTLGREITTDDYPYPKGLYGVLKIASEQAGFIFSLNKQLSVINIRIGSVPEGDETEAVEKNDRLNRTLLSRNDLVNLFIAAVETDVAYGTYYGVSNNPDKPWDLSNAKNDLGFISNHEN